MVNVRIEERHPVRLTDGEVKEMKSLQIAGGTIWPDYLKYKKDSGSLVFLAKWGDQIIGWGLRYLAADKKYYHQLFVKKGHRGKDVGKKIRREVLRSLTSTDNLQLGSYNFKE